MNAYIVDFAWQDHHGRSFHKAVYLADSFNEAEFRTKIGEQCKNLWVTDITSIIVVKDKFIIKGEEK